MAVPTELPATFAATLASIRARLPEGLSNPKIGIVCGSGLSGLASSMKDKQEIPYNELEGFGVSTVAGHQSTLAFGYLGERRVPVVAMLGRFHPYEGHTNASVVYPIRVLALLGVKQLIITNAAGALNPNIPVGTIVVVHDHLALPNLTGHLNPLLGPVLAPPFDTRFVPLSSAYSFALRKIVFKAAYELQFPSTDLEEGTYAWVSGPTYESAAEGRFLRNQGADVVGMSTVPEVVAARQAGLETLVLSLVTNKVVIPDTYRSARAEAEAESVGSSIPVWKEEEVSHAEVLEIGRKRGDDMRRLVEKVVDLISTT